MEHKTSGNDMVVDDGLEKLADWMTKHGYSTGHGDTIEDLLEELEWQLEDC